MTGLDKMKALALIENKEMIAKCGGRSLNYGIVQEHQKAAEIPACRTSEDQNPRKICYV